MPKQEKHILVIRLSAMGDVAMTVPVIRALTIQYPTIKITVLTQFFFKSFFRDLKNVTVFCADIKGKHKGIFGLYKLGRQLNRENFFYAVADLHCVLRSKVLKKYIQTRRYVSIDKGRAEKKALVSGNIFRQLKTTHERYADVFKTLGFSVDLSSPTFPPKEILNEKTLQFLSKNSKLSIGIAPFAAHEGKMYPLGLMKKVIENLPKEYHVILFGGGDQEISILSQFETTFKNAISVAGKLSMEDELDLISNLDVMLSMDSGNGHIAAMLGVKVVTIWGVTHPYAGFAPFNQPSDYMLLADREQFPKIPTSVYGNKYPKNYKEAIASISPEKVIEKIKSLV